jgi:hypothetical protein
VALLLDEDTLRRRLADEGRRKVMATFALESAATRVAQAFALLREPLASRPDGLKEVVPCP